MSKFSPILILAIVLVSGGLVGCTEKPAKQIGETAASLKDKKPGENPLVGGDASKSANPDRVGDVVALTDNLTGQDAVRNVRTEIANANETDLVIAMDVLGDKLKVVELDRENIDATLAHAEDMRKDTSMDQANVEKTIALYKLDQAKIVAELESLTLEAGYVKAVRDSIKSIQDARDNQAKALAAVQSEKDEAKKAELKEKMSAATNALNAQLALRDNAIRLFNQLRESINAKK